MKNYRYNYGFLSSWMKENKKNKTSIVKALGTQAYESVRRWMEGEMPMPVEAMLRLCNTFDISLSCFFLEGDTPSNIDPVKATIFDQTAPTGGRRKKGVRGRSDGMIDPNPLFRETSGKENPIQDEAALVKEDLERIKLELRYEKKINEMKDSYMTREDKLREDYDSKIASRDKMIAEQQKEINMLRQEVRSHSSCKYSDTTASDKAPFSQEGI